MSYIPEIRALVGHKAILMPAVAVLIIKDNKLLLQRRSDNYLWGIIGGYMEPGESTEQTARRESIEETNLRLTNLELLGVIAGEGSFYQYPNGDNVHIVSIVYLSENPHGHLNMNDTEGLELRYFALDALPDSADMMPPNIPILSAFLPRLQQRFAGG